MEFSNGMYIYKNETNDNGRVIHIYKTTEKSMRYSIGNYFDGKIYDVDYLVENKLTRKKDKIKLHLSFYYPQDATFIF